MLVYLNLRNFNELKENCTLWQARGGVSESSLLLALAHERLISLTDLIEPNSREESALLFCVEFTEDELLTRRE